MTDDSADARRRATKDALEKRSETVNLAMVSLLAVSPFCLLTTLVTGDKTRGVRSLPHREPGRPPRCRATDRQSGRALPLHGAMSPWVRRRLGRRGKGPSRFDLALPVVGFILVVAMIRMCRQ